ncbi:MAG: type I-A CRISPR-associated protein Cas5a, partial [Pyrobaculum sp.]
MRVILLDVNAPVFSVRHIDTYQVAVSYPIAPPHTVVGAVGRSLA